MGIQALFKKPSNLYIASIIMIGLALFITHFSFNIVVPHWSIILLSIFAVALLNIYLIYIPPRDNSLCLDATIYLSTLFFYGLETTLFILLLSIVPNYFTHKGTEWWKHLFNFSLYVSLYTIAYYIYKTLGGEIGALSLEYAHAYIVSTAIYFVVNIAVIASYFAIANSVKVTTMVKNLSDGSVTHYFATLILSIILLILIDPFPIFGLAVFTIIVVIVSIAFKNYYKMFEQVKKDKTYREQILNSLPVGIITSDDTVNEFFLNVTAKEVLKINEKEVIGQLRSDEQFWKIIRSREFCKNQKVLYKSQVLLFSQSELKNKNEQLIGRIIHFIDITEIEEMQRKIQQTEKLALLGEMSAGAAHEIRNPLTVISGFIKLMKQSFTKEQNEKYQLALLLKELDRINSIVDDMLLIARPTTQHLIKMSIIDIINEIPKLFNNNSRLKVTINLDDTKLFLDPKQMKQVLYNLARNSMEAMGGTGELSVYSVKKEKEYQLFIKDTGIGMPDETKKLVFNPFFTSKETGTGLGLTIVQRIVDNHGGTIEVYDTSEKGTTILITLPLPS
ncbi:two-component system sensor histidine kinase NtrB [Sutcliffiella sp. NC1]|uniref:two-component system sensor histidine kinase NtrB n=1 Tax=Sutcliffiella sp. NC1 TaxID=3004096 RepID=UPI0022DD9FA4|nr:ATP-binding protein [Sutcliffiella sp. NC1]WBL17701.1 ATP-binding protein [Sutcliffiella sp. NC1]